jgi:hypothetical protein
MPGLLNEHKEMKDRLIELEELCQTKKGEPLRWNGSGEPIACPGDNLDKAVHEAVAAIYLADNSDYLSALWSVVNLIDPKLARLLEKDEKKAYDLSEARSQGKYRPTEEK